MQPKYRLLAEPILTLEQLDLAAFCTDPVQDASREIMSPPKFESLSLNMSRSI